MRACFGYLTAVMLGFLLPMAGHAQESGNGTITAPHDLFVVHNVSVDATARSASVARAQAIRQGERQAFRRLLERLVDAEYVDRLAGLDSSAVSNLVHGLQFDNERSSQVRYMAELTVRFNADNLRELFRNARVPFTQTAGSPLLVIPVLEMDGARMLWQDGNIWFRAWGQEDLANRLLTYVLPTGSDTDRMTLNYYQAVAQSNDQRAVMASNYGLLGVFVPVATVDRDTAGPGYRVRVRAHHDDMRLADDLDDPMDQWTFRTEGDESLEETLIRAVRTIIAERDQVWKEQTMIRLDETQEMDVRVPIRSMADWSGVQGSLEGENLVQDVTLLAFRPGEARIRMAYAGRPEQLVRALSDRGLVLRGQGNEVFLMPAAVAEARGITAHFEGPPELRQSDAVTIPDDVPDGDFPDGERDSGDR